MSNLSRQEQEQFQALLRKASTMRKSSYAPRKMTVANISQMTKTTYIDEDMAEIQTTCNKTVRATLLIFCAVLTLCAMVLAGIGLFAPNWWYLDVSEYGQEWKFGLWMYCRRGGSRNEVGQTGIDLRSWICDLKQSTRDQQGGQPTGRLESPKMDASNQEYIALICLATAFLCGSVSLLLLCCAYCNRKLPYCLLFSNFVAMVTSLAGTIMYLVSMQDVEARRFTSFNSVYFAQFGDAAYCSVAGGIAFAVNFFVSIPLVFLTFVYGRQKQARNRASAYDLTSRKPSSISRVFIPSVPRARMDSTGSGTNGGGNRECAVIERDPDTKSVASNKQFDDDQAIQDRTDEPSQPPAARSGSDRDLLMASNERDNRQVSSPQYQQYAQLETTQYQSSSQFAQRTISAPNNGKPFTYTPNSTFKPSSRTAV